MHWSNSFFFIDQPGQPKQWVLLCVFLVVHVHAVCVCVFLVLVVYECMRRPEDNLGCHFSAVVHLKLSKGARLTVYEAPGICPSPQCWVYK